MDRLHPKQQEKTEAYQEQLFTDWVSDRMSESFECFLVALISVGNQRCGCSRSFSTTGTHVVEVTRKCCFPGLCSQRFPNFRCITSAAWQDTTHTHLESIPWPADVKSAMYWDKKKLYLVEGVFVCERGSLANGVDVLCVISLGAHIVTQSDQTFSKAPVYRTTWRGYCCTQHRSTETWEGKMKAVQSQNKKDLYCLICLHTGICLRDRSFQRRRKYRHSADRN